MKLGASFKSALLAAIAIAMLLTGGCYSSAPEGNAASNAGVKDGNAAAASPASTELPTFGIIYPMAHPFYEMITQYAKEAAIKSGVKLIVKAPDEANLEQQIRMMETMISQKVDGIAIDPVDKTALIPIIDKAVLAGIPVICFESDAPGSKRLSYIGADNEQAGQRMGKLLDGLLEGKGMVIMETGMADMTGMSERLKGLLDYLNGKTEIQVLEVRYNEGKEAAALSHLEEMIESHPHFDAFVALDVMSGSASVLVWKASGLNRYALAFGMMPEIQQAMDNGQITAVVSQHEQLWGERIVERLLDASRGIAIPPFDDMGMEEVQGLGQ